MIAAASQAWWALPAGVGGAIAGYMVGRVVGFRVGVLQEKRRLDEILGSHRGPA